MYERSTVPIANILIKEAFAPMGSSFKQRMIIEGTETNGLKENRDFIRPSIKRYNDSMYKLLGYEMNYRQDFPLFALILKKMISIPDLNQNELKISKSEIMRWFEIRQLNPNRIDSIYKSFIRIMNLKLVFYAEGDKYPTIQTLINYGKFDNDKNFIISFNSDFQQLCTPYINDNEGNVFNLYDKTHKSLKSKKEFKDRTYIDFDNFFKIKNETAMCLFCFLSTHDLKKPFSFNKIKEITNKSSQTNYYVKTKILAALNHLKDLDLLFDYDVDKNIDSKHWLKIIKPNLIEVMEAESKVDFEIDVFGNN
jgi:hypothetical protein